jgi:protein gp37
MRQAARIESFGTTPHYKGVTKIVNSNPVWTGKLSRSSEATFTKPLRNKTPSLYFVNSMSDFFHENAQDDWRLDALDIMRNTPHQYQILTKRPENIQPFIDRTGAKFPENAWLGVTVEHQKTKWRIGTLIDIDCSIRFLSIEPLIAPVGNIYLSGIHWVIVGGESGPGARPMRPEWVDEIVKQCKKQKVPFFFKQWGKAQNNPLFASAPPGMNPADYVKQVDPHGKGGSAVHGNYYKEFPNF